MKKNTIYIFVLIMLFVYGCKQDKFNIDVSNISIDVEIKRFDKDFFSINPDSIYLEIPRLQEEYGDFYELYNYEIINLGSPNEINYSQNIKKFFEYCQKYNLFQKVNEIFSNDEFLNEQFTEAFKHYKYYFPEKEIPTIYTCISGFNLSVFTSEGYMGISLDKYLGVNTEEYKKINYPQYMQRRMHKEMLTTDCMRAWCNAEYVFNDSINNLISIMIYEGRVQYFIDAMLPETDDTLKWGYTEKKYKWANRHEEKIWDYLIENKLLFSLKNMDIKTFTGEGGFTTPFHKKSAPRAGTFIGYKIVESYMNKHSEITLQQLMEATDYMKIYNESRYNP